MGESMDDLLRQAVTMYDRLIWCDSMGHDAAVERVANAFGLTVEQVDAATERVL